MRLCKHCANCDHRSSAKPVVARWLRRRPLSSSVLLSNGNPHASTTDQRPAADPQLLALLLVEDPPELCDLTASHDFVSLQQGCLCPERKRSSTAGADLAQPRARSNVEAKKHWLRSAIAGIASFSDTEGTSTGAGTLQKSRLAGYIPNHVSPLAELRL